MSGGPKKWFMLQIWRFQQVSQITTLALLALNLALQIYNFVSWRGSLFSSPYTAIPFILLVLVAGIWSFAIFWDLRMKMWREQQAVLIERNPYAKERMYSKELVIYAMLWLPLLDHLGEENQKIRASADHLRAWLTKSYSDDKALEKEIGELVRYIDMNDDDIFGLLKK